MILPFITAVVVAASSKNIGPTGIGVATIGSTVNEALVFVVTVYSVPPDLKV